jgi:uncharacterized membrane protein
MDPVRILSMTFLRMVIGAAAGAGAGALSGSLTDCGIDDDFVRKLGETIPAIYCCSMAIRWEISCSSKIPTKIFQSL